MIIKDMVVAVSREKILRRLGKRGISTGDAFDRIFEEEYEKAHHSVQIDSVLEELMVIKKDKAGLLLETVDTIEGGSKQMSISSIDVAARLKNCDYAWLLAVTVGASIQEASSSLMQSGDAGRALIVDTVGSELVEEAADEVCRFIEMKTGRRLTQRFSPGYGDWGLENQAEVDRILDLSRINVRLNAAYLMIPEKSVTAIVGVIGQL